MGSFLKKVWQHQGWLPVGRITGKIIIDGFNALYWPHHCLCVAPREKLLCEGRGNPTMHLDLEFKGRVCLGYSPLNQRRHFVPNSFCLVDCLLNWIFLTASMTMHATSGYLKKVVKATGAARAQTATHRTQKFYCVPFVAIHELSICDIATFRFFPWGSSYPVIGKFRNAQFCPNFALVQSNQISGTIASS